jgi:hypothetical protein
MKKISKYIFLISMVSVIMFGFSFSVYAVAPSISLTVNNDGDSAQLSVNGDPNVSVLLYYSKTGSGAQIVFLGTTNSNGYFSNSVSTAYYKIIANSSIYVITGGINGARSNTINWPNIQTSTTSNFSLSQTALLLNIGQTSTITASASYLYLLSNTNPAVANININSSQITVTANTYGSTVANICVLGSSTNCSSITITVQNSGASQLSFSQNNFSIVFGQSISVTVSGSSSSYLISSNSNIGSIQASLSGSVITLRASNSSGSASITVCTTNMASCGIINVSATTVNSSTVTFSQTNPVVQIGQSIAITIYGNSGTNFYVSSNSNPSIVQANINSNILTLIGNTTGSSTISVCAYAGSCASLIANVGSYTSGGSLSLSQNAVSILAGQSTNITILGGSMPYNISAPSLSNVFNGNINANILTIYGVNPGYATANICSSVGCVTLSVTINSTNSSGNASPVLSQNNISLSIGQQTTISISGSGSYYISGNSNYNIASAQINGNSVIVSALSVGNTNISICQLQSQCSIVYISVNLVNQTNSTLAVLPLTQSVAVGQISVFNATTLGIINPTYVLVDSFSGTTILNSNINSLGYFSWVPQQKDLGNHNLTVYATDSLGHSASTTTQINVTQATVSTPEITGYTFTRLLGLNDQGEDVLQLQKILVKQGFLLATPNGNYGPATKEAVKKFQKNNGINPIGLVGLVTKNALNKISTSSLSAGDLAKQQQILLLIQSIQQLQAQLNAMIATGQ